MNFKKKIIFTGLSLLLSSTFNSAYSADGDETNKSNDPSRKRFIHSVTESDGCGAGGGAGQPLEGLAKKSRNAPSSAAYFNQAATQSDGCGAGGGASSSSSASSAGKMPGDWAGQPLEGLAERSSNAPRGWKQHVRKGTAYFKQGKFPKAIAQFTAALAIEGIDIETRADCLFNLGNAYSKEGKIPEAIGQFTAVLAIEGIDGKTRADCLNGLGFAYFEQGSFPEAIDQFTAALAIEGIDGQTRAVCLNNLLKTHFNMAFECLHQKNDDESIAQFRFACYIEAAKCLFDAGARVDAVDNEGKTALHCAAEQYRGSVEIGTFLLERGANVNAADNEGKTALMHVVESFQDNEDYLEQLKARVTLLVNAGADIDIKDIHGKTVLEICESKELKKFINEAKEQYDCRGIGLK